MAGGEPRKKPALSLWLFPSPGRPDTVGQMADPTCYYCERPAEEECPTCGRLYCPEHGEDVCLRCMAPESVAPSARMYRGSILALVAATFVAVFLFVRPPESKSHNDALRTVSTSTPSFGATATATRQGIVLPGKTATPQTQPAGTAVPGSPTAAPTAVSPTPGGLRSYTVKAGDTLSDIATQFNTTVDAIVALNPGLNPNALAIGAELKIPAAQ